MGYVVKLLESANKSCRSTVNPLQPLHPNPRETSEDGTAIVKAAEYKSMNKGDSSVKSQRPSSASVDSSIYDTPLSLRGTLDHVPPERKP